MTKICKDCKKETEYKDLRKHCSIKDGALSLCHKCANKRNAIYKNNYRYGGKRKQVLERDGYACVICNFTEELHQFLYKRALHIDHIDRRGRNSKIINNSMDNLQTLCSVCHGLKDGGYKH